MNGISKEVEENIGRVRGSSMIKPVQMNSSQDALTTLKMRFAKGEITKEQYDEMRRTLE